MSRRCTEPRETALSAPLPVPSICTGPEKLWAMEAISRVLCPRHLAAPGRQPFIWGRRFRRPRAAYPGIRRQWRHRGDHSHPIFGLAPGGVWQAGTSPCRWWALTPPFHPYPSSAVPPSPGCARLRRPRAGFGAVSFLFHFPEAYARWVLPIAAIPGARTFLPRNVRERPPCLQRPTVNDRISAV